MQLVTNPRTNIMTTIIDSFMPIPTRSPSLFTNLVQPEQVAEVSSPRLDLVAAKAPAAVQLESTSVITRLISGLRAELSGTDDLADLADINAELAELASDLQAEESHRYSMFFEPGYDGRSPWGSGRSTAWYKRDLSRRMRKQDRKAARARFAEISTHRADAPAVEDLQAAHDAFMGGLGASQPGYVRQAQQDIDMGSWCSWARPLSYEDVTPNVPFF
jgi:hypothetical protein